ncbi:hypothetical protein Mp_5g05800 [Marchantia polymorpha subsp. ruderalis]|uniref:Uncharacterized protein n=2 Tax=Marchantia polymorpha TaxID=3197 RepID=A0AAF6BFC6_MARPO|nr:hypothetical protein MARPO_0027s0047 [Marchantia polymorpha]BBN10710.1 hypothetical protein Mp_5g05800 [Marchantia polymorpha subsp. ruderalis]|eukprot:PTQ42924.1 hypothetical protein MARPO_0027s0047 [Marchantia polymorpha]
MCCALIAARAPSLPPSTPRSACRCRRRCGQRRFRSGTGPGPPSNRHSPSHPPTSRAGPGRNGTVRVGTGPDRTRERISSAFASDAPEAGLQHRLQAETPGRGNTGARARSFGARFGGPRSLPQRSSTLSSSVLRDARRVLEGLLNFLNFKPT